MQRKIQRRLEKGVSNVSIKYQTIIQTWDVNNNHISTDNWQSPQYNIAIIFNCLENVETKIKVKSETTEATEEDRIANQIQGKKRMQVLTKLTQLIFCKFDKCEKSKSRKMKL